MDQNTYRHDLLRNVGCLLSGTEMLAKKKEQLDDRCNEIIREMNNECKNTLMLIEELFKELEKANSEKGRTK